MAAQFLALLNNIKTFNEYIIESLFCYHEVVSKIQWICFDHVYRWLLLKEYRVVAMLNLQNANLILCCAAATKG